MSKGFGERDFGGYSNRNVIVGVALTGGNGRQGYQRVYHASDASRRTSQPVCEFGMIVTRANTATTTRPMETVKNILFVGK